MEFRSRCCFCVRHEKRTDKLSVRQQSIYCVKNARNALSRKHWTSLDMYNKLSQVYQTKRKNPLVYKGFKCIGESVQYSTILEFFMQSSSDIIFFHPACPIICIWLGRKGLTAWLSCLLYFVTFPNVSWSTSELRAWLVPWNLFKPSSKIFYWPFQGGTSFVDHLCYLCLVFVMLSHLLIAALRSPARKGLTSWLLLVIFNCVFVTSHVVSWVRCGIDGIVSWSLPPFLLWCKLGEYNGILSNLLKDWL